MVQQVRSMWETLGLGGEKKHTLSTQRLALGHLAHEVGLLLFQICREALLLGLMHSLLNRFPLLGAVGLGLLLGCPSHAAVVSLQRFAEIWVCLAFVVKVHGIGCYE